MSDEQNQRDKDYPTSYQLKHGLVLLQEVVRNLEFAIDAYGEIEREAGSDSGFSPKAHSYRENVYADLAATLDTMLAPYSRLADEMIENWHPVWKELLDLEQYKVDFVGEQDLFSKITAPELWECPECGPRPWECLVCSESDENEEEEYPSITKH